jgi:hypothetical protein
VSPVSPTGCKNQEEEAIMAAGKTRAPAGAQTTVEITFSACGHTATFAIGAKTTSPARCPQGCDPLSPQHRGGR